MTTPPNAMTLDDIVAYFGNLNALSVLLNIKKSTVYAWAYKGRIPYWHHAYVKAEAAKHGLVIDRIIERQKPVIPKRIRRKRKKSV